MQDRHFLRFAGGANYGIEQRWKRHLKGVVEQQEKLELE